MENQTAATTKSDPLIIEQAGMRMTIGHRQGLGGSDEGLTFDITTAGPEDEGKRILRFDCFYKNRSEEHTSELQSRLHLVCRLLLEKKKPQPATPRGRARADASQHPHQP